MDKWHSVFLLLLYKLGIIFITIIYYRQGSFPVGTHGNGVPMAFPNLFWQWERRSHIKKFIMHLWEILFAPEASYFV